MLKRFIIFCVFFSLSLHSPAAKAEQIDLDTLYSKVVGLYNARKYEEAIPLAEKLLKLGEKEYGKNHFNIGAVADYLGRMYKAQGRYLEAEPLFLRNLAIYEKTMGKGNSLVGVSLNNLGDLYRSLGRFSEAYSFFERSLVISEKTLGKSHRSVGTTLHNLAGLSEQLGRYAQAEQLYKRSLTIFEKTVGKNHALVGASLNGLALLYSEQSRFLESEPLYKRSLSILENALGKDHPRVGATMQNLAGLYSSQGRYKEAELLFNRSIAVREKALGKDHPKLSYSYNNLAELYRAQGRYAEAELLYKRSIAIREKKFGKFHYNVGTSLNNLAGLYRYQGRNAEAEPLFKRSLLIVEKAFGKDHPSVGTSLNNLAGFYGSQGRYVEATAHYERALKIYEKALGKDHPGLGGVLHNLALSYDELQRFDHAVKIRQRLALMPSKGTRHVPLYVVSNRAYAEKSQFGSSSSKNMSFNRVVMQVPASELKKLGERRAKNLRLENTKTGNLTKADILKLVRVKKIKSLKKFANSAKSSQEQAAIFKNQALIFIHGFNNSFEGAMKRAAQLGFDLQFDGIMIPFAWPSQAKVTAYLKDGKMAAKSVDPLVKFLDQLSEMLPGVKLHFLAHSMGNQIMLEALCKIAKRKDGKKHNFGQVISAHADTSHEDFEALTKCFKFQVEGTTLYVNESDTALRLRCAGISKCRAGNYARGYESADVIDTTKMSSGFFRTLAKGFDHDIFVRNPLLFSDIARLILSGQRPVHDRTQEFRAKKGPKGNVYWTYDKSYDPAAKIKKAMVQ